MADVSILPCSDIDRLVAALSDADEDDERIRQIVSDPAHTSYEILAGAQQAGAATMRWDAAESELVYIAIDGARRGQGIGQAAVALVVEEARRRGIASLIVGTGNTGFEQFAFYQKCGFRFDSVRRDHFSYFTQPVFDKGIQIRDMVVLRLDLDDAAELSQPDSPARDWDILIIGGASGVGKSSVSYRAAQHFGVGIVEVDDFQVVVELMTSPDQYPPIHAWRTHQDPFSLTSEQVVDMTLAYGKAMLPPLEAVIANHLESERPAVLEGDYILPELAAYDLFNDEANLGRVRGVFIDEPNEAQIVANYLAREPDAGEQSGRAKVSKLYNDWLRREAERLGLISLPARPWDTLLERLIDALR
jgi:GNAT superfamily N-acetyltransferase